MDQPEKITRREALKRLFSGSVAAVGATYGLSSCFSKKEDKAPVLIEDQGLPVTKHEHQLMPPASLLGYGCMRFPLKPGTKEVDEEKTQTLIDYAMAHGVNYYDTAYVYHGGKSEGIIGRALKKYDRSSYYLADKLPTWLCHSLDDGKRLFQEQLDRCGVEYFDFYLLHALKNIADFEENYVQTGVWEYLKEERRQGRVRHLGFSFHGDMHTWEHLMAWHDNAASAEDKFDFVQIQMNYYDWDDPVNQSEKLYRDLEKRNIPVIIMEPLRGGMLAKLNKGGIRRLAQANPDRTPGAWALSYCASFPAVLTVLSGMTKMEHLVDNVNTLSTQFKPLSSDEMTLLYQVIKEFKANQTIPCTECQYCMPCPYGVNIPGNFMAYNASAEELELPDPKDPDNPLFTEHKKKFLARYSNSLAAGERADHCTHCAKCVSKCPQHIKIPKFLKTIDQLAEDLRKTDHSLWNL